MLYILRYAEVNSIHRVLIWPSFLTIVAWSILLLLLSLQEENSVYSIVLCCGRFGVLDLFSVYISKCLLYCMLLMEEAGQRSVKNLFLGPGSLV